MLTRPGSVRAHETSFKVLTKVLVRPTFSSVLADSQESHWVSFHVPTYLTHYILLPPSFLSLGGKSGLNFLVNP